MSETNFFNTPWSERPNFEKGTIIVGSAVLLYIGYREGKAIVEKAKTNRDIRNRKDEIVVEKTFPFSYPPYVYQSTINLTDIAYRIYDSFTNNDWFGLTEDEEGAVKSLQEVPREYIPKLAQVYNRNHKRNLYHDFKKYLGEDYYQETVAGLLS